MIFSSSGHKYKSSSPISHRIDLPCAVLDFRSNDGSETVSSISNIALDLRISAKPHGPIIVGSKDGYIDGNPECF